MRPGKVHSYVTALAHPSARGAEHTTACKAGSYTLGPAPA